jgi:ribonuclease D
LIGIVNFLPSTIEELLITPSIGKVTIEKYGEELLEIVHNYRKEENSEAPKSIFTEIKESEK